MTRDDSPRKYLLVVELDADMPRRDPEKPHLYVALSVDVPEARLGQLLSGKGQEAFRGRYLRLRSDLSPYTGSSMSHDEAGSIIDAEKLRLTRLGHAVNGVVSMWHGYVIDLKPPKTDPAGIKKYVYVGQTSRTPQERFLQHAGVLTARSGRDIGSKKVVRNRHLGLNYDLMKSLSPPSPVYTHQDALDLEKAWARELFNRGYIVEAGEATPGRSPRKAHR